LSFWIDRHSSRQDGTLNTTVYEMKIVLPGNKPIPSGIVVDQFTERSCTNDTPTQITFHVRKNEVRVMSEGELVCRISGGFSQLPVPAASDQPKVLRLKAKGEADESFRLHQAYLDISPPPLQPITAKPLPKP
jgi:hypothetical protein